MSSSRSQLAASFTINTDWLRWLALPAALLVTIFAGYIFSSPFGVLQQSLHDAAWRHLAVNNAENRVAIIAIDEKSIAEIGAWPWSREIVADLADKLATNGVAFQGYDIVFAEPKEGDANLRRALLQQKAIVAQVPFVNKEQAIRTGSLHSALVDFDCTSRVVSGNGHLGLPETLKGVSAGHISPVLDVDGGIRSLPPVVCSDGQAYMSLALSLYSQVASVTPYDLAESHNFFGSSSQLNFKEQNVPAIPLDEDGLAKIGFTLTPENISVFSATDILNNRVAKERLEGRIALVGATAFGLGDVVPTPFSGKTPGIFISALALSNLLDEQTPYVPSNAWLIQLVQAVFAALVIYLLGANVRSHRWLPYVAVVLPISIALCSAFFQITLNVLVPWMNVALFSLALAAMYAAAEYMQLKLERSRLLDNFYRYMPASMAEKIAYSLPSGVVEAERVPLVVLNADLRNFSAFEEKRPPEESAALLHMFYVEASAIIEAQGGIVQEFRGDALLATWSGDQTLAVKSSLLAAESIVDKVSAFLPQQPPSGLEPLAIGVGIEQGNVLQGSIGPVNRRAHALLGDAVTLAIRIQEMTSDLSEAILLGEQAASKLSEHAIQSQGTFILTGLASPQELFAPAIKVGRTSEEQTKGIYIVK
jgi:CHASE2 domain-containing sensor protein/class 3 adenylate cyclase